jgi:SAM-dependent methyltransferase
MPESVMTPTAAATLSATNVYALGRDPGESARLQRQSEELQADSAALLDRLGLGPGQAAIDLGCGPRGILDLLAGRVSPGGRVVGLDADPAHVAMARQFTAQHKLGGVTIVAADARATGLPPGSFDLVHARTLLVNVPDPAEISPRWSGWPSRAAGSPAWNRTRSIRCVTQPTAAIPGCGNCSAPPSAATAPICSSAAACPRYTGTLGYATSASRRGRACTGPVTPAG